MFQTIISILLNFFYLSTLLHIAIFLFFIFLMHILNIIYVINLLCTYFLDLFHTIFILYHTFIPLLCLMPLHSLVLNRPPLLCPLLLYLPLSPNSHHTLTLLYLFLMIYPVLYSTITISNCMVSYLI